ncbi:MAG: hypothetical protein WBH97_02000 [Rectinemataceae bacterium]
MTRIPATVLFLAAAFLAPLSLGAQDLAAWFAKSANTASYGPIRPETEILAAQLRDAGLSDSLLASRLQEGARKHVPQATLLATLRTDSARACAIAAAMKNRGLLPESRDRATESVEQIAILFRAGIGEPELSAALDASLRHLSIANARAEVALARTLATLSVVAAAEAEYRLPQGDRLRLTVALAQSPLADDDLASVLDSIAAYAAEGRPAVDALALALEQASKGNAFKAKSKIQSSPPAGSKSPAGSAGSAGSAGAAGGSGSGKPDTTGKPGGAGVNGTGVNGNGR